MIQPVDPWIVEAFENKTWCPTRGGDKRRVICVDSAGDQPIISLDAAGYVYYHHPDGTVRGNPKLDLLPPSRKWEEVLK